MGSSGETLKRILSIVSGSGDRIERATQLAKTVRSLGNYRWTGVYDVGKEIVSIIAYSGLGAPAYPTFPVTQGLTGSAIRSKATVVVGDVRTDPRYLTAFGSTLSEIIVPIVDPQSGTVIGTIDVESERANAFSASDQHMLEECTRVALSLWVNQKSL
jgi:putative methionine-R-sulfoxide reductase with GAF domain